MPILERNFSIMIFNFIQWVLSRPRYLQVGPDLEKFGNHWHIWYLKIKKSLKDSETRHSNRSDRVWLRLSQDTCWTTSTRVHLFDWSL